MNYYYLATPYSKFPGGIEAAFRLACSACASLVKARVPVFSPIAHSHTVALAAGMNPRDHAVWMPADKPMMERSFGLVVLCAEGWQESKGIAEEIKAFKAMAKPITYLEPEGLKDFDKLASLRHAIAAPALSMPQIVAHVGFAMGVGVTDILSTKRALPFVVPRQTAMTMCREFTGYSLPRIGRFFHRDHTTILHALRATKERCVKEPEFARDVEKLRARLNAVLKKESGQASGVSESGEAAAA